MKRVRGDVPSIEFSTCPSPQPSPQPKSGLPDFGQSKSAELGQARVRAGRGSAPNPRRLKPTRSIPCCNGSHSFSPRRSSTASSTPTRPSSPPPMRRAQAVEVARAALLAEIEARKSANAVILAEQGRWYTAIIRPLLAAPVVIYLWKVIVWDIVLALGTTDPIGGDVAEWAGWIVTAYVGGRSLEKIARTIWRRP